DYAAWLRLAKAVDGKLTLHDLVPPSVPRVHDAGDHVNMIALAFNLTLPFVLVVALESRRKAERALAIVAAALVVLALFFTVSRAAWVSAAVALPLFALLYSRRERGVAGLEAPRLSRLQFGAGAAATAIVVLLGAGLLAARWDSRPEWLFRSSLSPRYDAFSVGLHIFRDDPWTGSGPNTYSLLYNVYSGDYPIEDFHPHNGYIAVGDDTGIVGVAAVAFLGIVLVWSLITSFVRGDPRERVYAAACLAALAALAVHSAADMPNQSKTALLLVAVIAALAMKLSPPRQAPSRLLSAANLPRLAVLVFLPLLFGAWLWTDIGHARYDDSLHRLGKGDFAAATRKALDAADKDPDFAAYQFQAGVAQAIEYLVRQEKGDTNPVLLDGAIDSLRSGIASEPRSGIGHANLALALRMRGDRQEAVGEARLALQRAPGDGTIAAVAATVLEWAGEDGEAMYAYSSAVTHDDALIDSPFWTANAFRKDARDGVVDSTFLSPCQKGRTIALYRGYPDDLAPLAEQCAKEVAASGDVRRQSDLAIIRAAMGDAAGAKQQAQAAADRAPDNAYARTALAIALAPGGDLDAVRRQLMLAADLGDPDGALLLYYTYAQPPTDIARNTQLPTSATQPPKQVIDRLQKALPASAPFVYDSGIQDYLLGILYYRPRYFRESPTSILIPGDWINLASPRTLFIQQALKEARAGEGAPGASK
ncbi:MAG TPA: O-antigen ligase family protein, partial [Dehalococcoidia bacterium]